MGWENMDQGFLKIIKLTNLVNVVLAKNCSSPEIVVSY
jgi:hypothetical protein